MSEAAVSDIFPEISLCLKEAAVGVLRDTPVARFRGRLEEKAMVRVEVSVAKTDAAHVRATLGTKRLVLDL